MRRWAIFEKRTCTVQIGRLYNVLIPLNEIKCRICAIVYRRTLNLVFVGLGIKWWWRNVKWPKEPGVSFTFTILVLMIINIPEICLVATLNWWCLGNWYIRTCCSNKLKIKRSLFTPRKHWSVIASKWYCWFLSYYSHNAVVNKDKKSCPLSFFAFVNKS